MPNEIGSVVTVEDMVNDYLKGDPAYLVPGTPSQSQRADLGVWRLEELCRRLAREIDKVRARIHDR